MAEEEITEDSSNTSSNNSSYHTSTNNSPSKPLCQPGSQDVEQSAAVQEKQRQNSRFCRDQTYNEGPLCTDQSTQVLMTKVPTSSKKMRVHVFLMMERGEREGSGVWGGREEASFQFRAQTSQSILTQTLGLRTGWRLRTADWRFLSTQDFFLNTSSHWWGGKGRGISVCLGGPAGERGDGGVVALCSNQIPL